MINKAWLGIVHRQLSCGDSRDGGATTCLDGCPAGRPPLCQLAIDLCQKGRSLFRVLAVGAHYRLPVHVKINIGGVAGPPTAVFRGATQPYNLQHRHVIRRYGELPGLYIFVV